MWLEFRRVLFRSVASWVGDTAPFTYIIANTDVSPTSTILISPSASCTKNQLEGLQSANIVGGTQSEGSFVLRAFGDKPTIVLPIVLEVID